jgi:bifunctional UDP-N-acetylglucosamine pyrophosphorylase/glucosamine-1-phosphate N-acetyltransferase
VEQTEQLGPGHALQQVQIKGLLNDRFIVMNGDDLFSRADIEACLQHRYCVLARKVDDPSKFGVCVVEGELVKEIIEKPENPTGNLANTGLYVFDKQIFNTLLQKTERGEYEITDYIRELVKWNKRVHCKEVQGYWMPVGYPWHILEANEQLLKELEASGAEPDMKGQVEERATLKGYVSVGEGTVIKNGAYIEGPVMIGKNCTIGPNCFIRPYTSIGNGCKVGNAVEVKNCVLMNNVSIGHLSYFGDSVLGNDVNIGAGTITANLRHDNQNISTDIKGKIIDSGRRKLGTIIGDGVHTGINTSIYPGRKIWPGKTTLPGEIVKEDLISQEQELSPGLTA